MIIKKSSSIICVLLTILLLSVSLTGCGKASKVTISDVETNFNITCDVTSTSSGCSFSYTEDNVTYIGVANKSNKVKSLTITHSDIQVEKLTNESELERILMLYHNC